MQPSVSIPHLETLYKEDARRERRTKRKIYEKNKREEKLKSEVEIVGNKSVIEEKENGGKRDEE
jgi:hypothetical protein